MGVRLPGASVRIVNRDHRRAVVWWLDGHHAKQQGVVEADGGTFERSSFISHRWYVWPEGTEGNILSQEASLGEITLSRVGEIHDLQLSARCIDSNGHCHQWKHLGECEKNRVHVYGVPKVVWRLRWVGLALPSRPGAATREARLLGRRGVSSESPLPRRASPSG